LSHPQRMLEKAIQLFGHVKDQCYQYEKAQGPGIMDQVQPGQVSVYACQGLLWEEW